MDQITYAKRGCAGLLVAGGGRVGWTAIGRLALPMRVLALRVHDSDRYLAEMWEAGARGCLLKAEPLERIASAIPPVARGAWVFVTCKDLPVRTR
ncbi:MAG TPA: hypothetical protein VNK89_02640 [Thermoflexus sp.]|uniref:hypothetical protein n=1 Tax=Thermoflexus sp. TaxID=1969742 RepID=UPI002C706006|nr:hypothetical protein [Thermoflexus sp.]